MRRRSSRRGGKVVPFLLGFLTGRLTLRRLGGIVGALWLGAWLVLNTWQGQLVLVVGVAVAFLVLMNKAGIKGLSWPSRNPLDSSPLLDVPPGGLPLPPVRRGQAGLHRLEQSPDGTAPRARPGPQVVHPRPAGPLLGRVVRDAGRRLRR